MPDLVIRGGTLVTPAGLVKADLAIEDQFISAIAPELPAGREEIDARGLTILPGLIDVHVHFNEPGRAEWEGIATGSSALAAGGGTLFFDMPLNSTPCTVDGAGFDAKLAAMQVSSITDFALWGGIVPGNVEQLPELAARGVIGFKAFMADSGLPEFARSDDLTLFEGMRAAARAQLPVAVHAESDDITKGLTSRIRQEGRTGVRDFLESRPVLAELEAIQRATLLAAETGVSLHIVHVSTGRGVALAAEARARGVDVSIETCPHYLFFTDEDMVRIGAAAKCAPPLRSAADHEELWRRLHDGCIDIVASDHSPSTPELKQDADFFHVWGGIAGVQTTRSVLLHGGNVPLERIAALTAQNPARRFGIAQKGSIEVGKHADLALMDPRTPFTLDRVLYRHQLSPYLGCTFPATLRRTILRGQTIFPPAAAIPPMFIRKTPCTT